MARDKRGLDYSIQLSDVEAPSQGKGGDLLLAAGQTEAAGKAATGKAIAGGIEFLGTMAGGAVKGKMEADLERDINANLNKLEGVGAGALESQKNLDKLRSPEFAEGVADQLTVLREQSGEEEPQLMKDFLGDISRHADAQKQGILSRGEVVSRIAADVKRYSAMLPGLASDFRKTAANLTGISNIDVYGIHQALTTKSASEKAAEAQIAAQVALDKEIASEQGVPLNAITPQMRAYHYQSKQLKLAADNSERQVKLQDLGQAQADKAYGQIVDMRVAGAVSDFGKEFAKLTQLYGDPSKSVEADKFGLELSGKVAQIGQQLEQDIMRLSKPEPGKPAMSSTAVQTRLEGVRKTIAELREGVKSVEGRSMVAALVKKSENDVKLLGANITLANPYIAGLNKLGMNPSELFKLWMTVPREEFEKRVPAGGKQLAQAFENVLKNPVGHVNTMLAIATGQQVDLGQLATVDPDLHKVVANDLVSNIRSWITDPAPTPEKKQAFSNTFATATLNINPLAPQDLKLAHSIVSDGAAQKFLGTLSLEQRTNALLPLLVKLDNGVKNARAQIETELRAFNDKDNNPSARLGAVLEMKQNALTGAFEIAETHKASGPGIAMTEVPGGGVVGMRTGAFAAVTRTNAAEARARASDLAGRLNRMVETYTLGVRSLGVDEAPTLKDVRQSVVEGRSLRGGDVPRNDVETSQAEPTIDMSKGLQAVQVAERTDKGENLGTSPKGARGPFQFMPEIAKAYGLKVDPRAGIDERMDLEKAGAAAQKMLADLFKQFKGNVEHVAAAYNAGSGNVTKAIAKATKLGVPEDWKSFLPKPEETVPYIRRFVSAYQNEQQ